MHEVWGNGQLLAFSGIDGPTDFYGGLTLRTVGERSGGPGAGIAVKLPAEALLSFSPVAPLRCALGGDHFELELSDGTRVRGALLDAWHLLIDGPVQVEGGDARLAIRQQGSRTLVAAAGRLDARRIDADLDAAIAARRHWVAASPLASTPALGKALSQLKTMIYSPEGVFRRRFSTPDRWPHRGCWLWDSAFHAIGARWVDSQLARELLTAVFDAQRPDGQVSIRVDPDNSKHAEFTQPPTLALAAWCIEGVASDPAWVAELAPRLEAYLDWDVAHRDAGHGLPHWFIEGNVNCRSGESGLDNSSRFDAATDLEAVDFASFLALEYELLGRLHARDARATAAARCAGKAERLRGLIRERLWDEASGLFRDRDASGWCPVAAATAFLPLICGAATPAQAQRLAEALADPQRFGTAVPLPSVARNDTTYTDDMWRGPVWVNLVWLAAAGFARYGLIAEAQRLRHGIVTEIERWHATHGTFYEFFDPDGVTPPDRLRRKGRCAPEVSPYHQCFHDYGWTATLYLDLVAGRGEPLPAMGI